MNAYITVEIIVRYICARVNGISLRQNKQESYTYPLLIVLYTSTTRIILRRDTSWTRMTTSIFLVSKTNKSEKNKNLIEHILSRYRKQK